MPHDTSGSIEYQLPWKQVEGAFMRVGTPFSAFAAIIDDRKLTPPIPLGAYGIAVVEILIIDAAMRHQLAADTGSESLWMQMPVKHPEDFRVFIGFFDERRRRRDGGSLGDAHPEGLLVEASNRRGDRAEGRDAVSVRGSGFHQSPHIARVPGCQTDLDTPRRSNLTTDPDRPLEDDKNHSGQRHSMGRHPRQGLARLRLFPSLRNEGQH